MSSPTITETPIAVCTVPKYITKVQTSKSRRAKYYSKYKSKGVSRSYTDYDGSDIPIPKSYMKKVKDKKWGWNADGYLIDEDEERVIANPRSVGTPNYEALSGNRFASGYSTPFLRNKLVQALKDFYRPFVRDQLSPFSLEDFPIWVQWECHTTIDRNLFDLSNFWFYYKYLEDCLTDTEDVEGKEITPIIPDDNIKFVTAPGRPILFPIDDWEERKFVFKFYRDDRPEIRQHPFWNADPNPSTNTNQ